MFQPSVILQCDSGFLSLQIIFYWACTWKNLTEKGFVQLYRIAPLKLPLMSCFNWKRLRSPSFSNKAVIWDQIRELVSAHQAKLQNLVTPTLHL